MDEQMGVLVDELRELVASAPPISSRVRSAIAAPS